MFYKTLVKGFLSVMKVGELYWKGIMECTDPTVLGFSIMDLCQFFAYRILIGHELCGIHLCGSNSQGKWSIFLKISFSCLVATTSSSSLLERQL